MNKNYSIGQEVYFFLTLIMITVSFFAGVIVPAERIFLTGIALYVIDVNFITIPRLRDTNLNYKWRNLCFIPFTHIFLKIYLFFIQSSDQEIKESYVENINESINEDVNKSKSISDYQNITKKENININEQIKMNKDLIPICVSILFFTLLSFTVSYYFMLIVVASLLYAISLSNDEKNKNDDETIYVSKQKQQDFNVDNDNPFIKVVNLRVKAMSLNSEGTDLPSGGGIDELGQMHYDEYKNNEYNVPDISRKKVAIDRLEGFFNIRNYIQKKGSNEQRFHLDASIVGALLYAASFGNSINNDLLKYQNQSAKLKSKFLSELYNHVVGNSLDDFKPPQIADLILNKLSDYENSKEVPIKDNHEKEKREMYDSMIINSMKHIEGEAELDKLYFGGIELENINDFLFQLAKTDKTTISIEKNSITVNNVTIKRQAIYSDMTVEQLEHAEKINEILDDVKSDYEKYEAGQKNQYFSRKTKIEKVENSKEVSIKDNHEKIDTSKEKIINKKNKQNSINVLANNLRELNKLKDEGLLTIEEFNEEKKKLLNGN